MILKYELVLGNPNNTFLHISIRNDEKEKCVETYLHEVDPLRNASGNNEVIIFADIRHIQRRFGCQVDPMLCKGDLDFFSIFLATPTYQRLRTHGRTT